MVAKWKAVGREQIICQAELVTVPLALETWRDEIVDRDLLIFIDNDPAREALIKGASSANDSSHYVQYCRLICAEVAAAPWYARVASPSNIADQPSRGDFRFLQKLGAKWREPAALACELDLDLFDF